MSTRLSDITRESDLAQESFVDTQDLDPDPANGLKNENQQRGEIRNSGPVRQQPIRVPMDQPQQIPFPNRPQIPFPNQPQSEGLRDILTDIVTERQVPEGVLGGPAAPVSPIPLPAIRNYQRVGQNSVLLGLRQGLQNPISGFGTKQIQQNEPGFTPVQNLRDATIEGQFEKAQRELGQLGAAGRSLVPDVPSVSVPQTAPPGVTQSGFAPIPNLPPQQQQNQGFSQIGDPATTQVQQLQSNPGLFERVTGIQTAPPGLTGGPPVAFDPITGSQLLQNEITQQDVTQQLTDTLGINDFQARAFPQNIQNQPTPPFIGPPAIGVGRVESGIGRLRNAPSAIRGLPGRARSALSIRSNRGQVQLGDLAGGAKQAGQKVVIRGKDILPGGGPPRNVNDPFGGPPGASRNPIQTKEVNIGSARLRTAEMLDDAMRQISLERRLAAQAQADESIRLFNRAQRPQAVGATGGVQTLVGPDLGFPQTQGLQLGTPGVQQLGQFENLEFSQLPQPDVGLVGQQTNQQPDLGFSQSQGLQFREIPRPEIMGQRSGGFGRTRQFPGQDQFGRIRPSQSIMSQARGGTITTQVSRGDTTFPPINPTFPSSTTRFPPIDPTFPAPQPTPTTFVPGIPPTPVPLGGGGGGGPVSGKRRGFAFGRVREFSPAFPGTAIRVLPNGSVVLDLDPGERRTSNGQQPRDPQTGRFVSRGN